MKWQKIELLKSSVSDTDELGNDINEQSFYMNIKARISPFEQTESRLDTRDVYIDAIALITNSKLVDLVEADAFEFMGIKYAIEKLVDYGRFRYIVGKRVNYD